MRVVGHLLAVVATLVFTSAWLAAQQVRPGDDSARQATSSSPQAKSSSQEGTSSSPQATSGVQQAAGDEAGDIPVIRTTTTLVFLDVTVLDKKGLPVVTGLSRDDFSITEDKKPERIFSFEGPEVHVAGGDGEGQVPETILVLDLLNTPYSDFAYIRDQARKFLMGQPEELRGAAELMVVGNQSLELLQGFTHSRSELLFALDHLPAATPYELWNSDWKSDRIRQSYIALQQIAVQNRGVPGRKNVMWIGNGSPNLSASDIPDPIYDKVQAYVHRTVNLMVESRITLFLIYPGMRFAAARQTRQAKQDSDLISRGDSIDPFANSSFTQFVYETGGKVFERNDVGKEIVDSVQLGSMYYTLTYQPHEDKADGAFRRIQVKLRNADLQVMTKAGFFARVAKEAAESDELTINILTEAAMAVIPMKALDLSVTRVVRHPDAHTAEVTVQLQDRKLGWEAGDAGASETTVVVAAASKSGRGDVLASKFMKFELLARSRDADRLAEAKPTVKFTLRVPRNTKSLRVAIATSGGGRIGTVDLTRKQIDAAPEAPTPDPQLRVPRVRVRAAS